jgi:hypothetical protein
MNGVYIDNIEESDKNGVCIHNLRSKLRTVLA